jgi:hypothetical protein
VPGAVLTFSADNFQGVTEAVPLLFRNKSLHLRGPSRGQPRTAWGRFYPPLLFGPALARPDALSRPCWSTAREEANRIFALTFDARSIPLFPVKYDETGDPHR